MKLLFLGLKRVVTQKCLQKMGKKTSKENLDEYYHGFLIRCVRGENGPTAYIIEKLDDNSSRFTWLLNVDLKV